MNTFTFRHPAIHPLPYPATTAQQCKAIGLDWVILEAPVSYVPAQRPSDPQLIFAGASVLYRSDTLQALSIVSSHFNPTQPDQALEYFQRFSAFYEQPLVCAGALQGGKIVWGLIRTGHVIEIRPGERAWAHLLLTTRCDSYCAATLSGLCILEATGTSLPVSLESHPPVAIPRSSEFLPPDVLIDITACNVEAQNFLETLQFLAGVHLRISPVQFITALYDEGRSKPRSRPARAIEKILTSLKRESPSGLDLVLAVAEYEDHTPSRRSTYDRLYSAWFGSACVRKQSAITHALDLLA